MAGTESQTVFDIPADEAEDNRQDGRAEAELAAGQGIPHERVREWLALRAKGKKVPPPAS